MYNIWHIGYEHRFDDIRIYEKECKDLAKISNYDVTYITSDKSGKLTSKDSDKTGNVTIKTINLVDKKGKRLFNYFKVLKIIITNQLDSIALCHIHELVLWPLIKLLKKNKIKVILDIHEDYIDDTYSMVQKKYGRVCATIVKWILMYFEKSCLKKADAVISVTPHLDRKVGKYNARHIMIANYPRSNDGTQPRNLKEYKHYANRLCFAGGISDLWSHKEIIRVIQNIPNVKYNLAGPFQQSYLSQLKLMTGWKDVCFKGKIEYNDVLQMYRESGIGMVLCKKEFLPSKIREEGTLGNTKLFEFMQNGLPIICTDFTIWKSIVETFNCGIAVNPADIEQIREAIMSLLCNPDLAYQMGQNGRKAIKQKYNWESDSKKLLMLYKEIMI